ncbi:MAG: hypothetical protein KDD66_12670 [Bdellovibrionales bacterium]|nr:hypothetical protein [Bdellovibrionales bacterium]
MDKINRSKWWSERWVQAFYARGLEHVFEQGEDYLRKRRSLDFLITPCLVTARVFDDERRPIRVKIAVSELDEHAWDAVFSLVSSQALFLARILAGDLPKEFAERCEELNVNIFPTSEDISIETDGSQKISQYSAAAAAATIEALERDPLALFLLRGLGKEQFLYRLREHRVLKGTSPESVGAEQLIPSLRDSNMRWNSELSSAYWELGESLDDLSYRIRADELPAALLRRLDALPLGSLTSDVERTLEEAYAHIATRAQAFGLGM